MIRTIGQLDEAHLRVLAQFARSQFDLFGLRFPSGEPELRPPAALGKDQLVTLLGAGAKEVIDGLVAVLISLGLLNSVRPFVGSHERLSLTAFGAAVAERLALVGEAGATSSGTA